MTHWEKVDYYYKDMRRRGRDPVWGEPREGVPILFRLYRRLGLEIRPPLFASFVSMAIVTGSVFAILNGLLKWWHPFFHMDNHSLTGVWVTSIIAGALFGASIAGRIRVQARRLGLPDWQDYPDDPTTGSDDSEPGS